LRDAMGESLPVVVKMVICHQQLQWGPPPHLGVI